MRPSADSPPEIILAQKRALASWYPLFDEIVYFGKSESDYLETGPKVIFEPCSGKPSIGKMCQYAAQQQQWACLVNADIIIGSSLPKVMSWLEKNRLKCAVSLRWELEEAANLNRATIKDNGLDWFAATPDMWALAASEIPPELCMGRIIWDSWMLGFFMARSGGACADITQSKTIFHPRHDDRRDQNFDIPQAASKYNRWFGWPKVQI